MYVLYILEGRGCRCIYTVNIFFLSWPAFVADMRVERGLGKGMDVKRGGCRGGGSEKFV